MRARKFNNSVTELSERLQWLPFDENAIENAESLHSRPDLQQVVTGHDIRAMEGELNAYIDILFDSLAQEPRLRLC